MKFNSFVSLCEEEVLQQPQQPQQPKPDLAPPIPNQGVRPAAILRDKFSERVRDRLQGYERGHDGKINRALGGSPFADADPNSDTYKQQFPRLQRYMEMTPDQKTALGMYGENVQGYYRLLNSRLRGRSGAPRDQETSQLLDYMQEHLNGALNRIDPTEARGVQFADGPEYTIPGNFSRAVSGTTAKELAGLKVGDELEDKGFGSYTDQGPRTLDMFLNEDPDTLNAVIRLAEGSKLRDISPITEYDEGEHIATPGSRFKVKSIDPEGYFSRKVGKKIPLYVLEMLEDLRDDGKINNSNRDD